ncbi:autotransporter outer membrane beta-barrel domain-containing protein [Escherichia albertii]
MSPQRKSNRYVVQLGGDLAQWNGNSQDRWHLGIMGGYANEHSNTRNERVGYHSDGRIDGYSVGMYGTWYQNDADKVGAYVDSESSSHTLRPTISTTVRCMR